MTIVLGALTLDEATTAAREQYEEVGGRGGRSVVLTGLVTGEVEARLDEVLAAASEIDYSCALSLRPGRRLWVRRVGFSRETLRDRGLGSFELKLETRDEYEESIAEHAQPWTIAASGAAFALQPAGNAAALPIVSLTADATLVNPSLSDGERNIAYSGSVAAGHTLVFDSAAERVLLDGADVLPYTTGAFPRLAPGAATLTYTDDPASAHRATATVSYRDRWW
jgi:hypothetical protein